MMDKCNNCGGELYFSPESKGNACESCGSVFPIAYNYQFSKKPFTDIKNVENEEGTNLKQIKCSSCGASVLLGKHQVQTNCPYCGNTALSVARKTNMMNVDSVIPFSFGKAEALKRFKSNVGGRFFANKKIFKDITEKDINGVYVNAFVFDFTTSTSYNGVFSYEKTIKHSDGRTSTKTIRKAVNGTLDKIFKNITVEANSNLSQHDLESVEPFQYASAVEYNDDFMQGYMLEYQDRMFNDCVKIAEKTMEEQIKNALLNNHGCTRIESLNMSVNYVDKKYNYCLLPVYFVTTENHQNGKKYKALMNGQTGKVGSLPLDKLKVLLTVLLSCGIFVGIVLLVVFFVVLK